MMTQKGFHLFNRKSNRVRVGLTHIAPSLVSNIRMPQSRFDTKPAAYLGHLRVSGKGLFLSQEQGCEDVDLTCSFSTSLRSLHARNFFLDVYNNMPQLPESKDASNGSPKQDSRYDPTFTYSFRQ